MTRITASEKRKIMRMRQQGCSIEEIALALNRSKSTVTRHIKAVKILPEFYSVWKSKRGGSAKYAEQRRQTSYSKASEVIKDFNRRDQLIIAACLYWGEGNKKEFSFSNTDARLVETFVNCLTKLGVKKERLKISIRIYEDIDQAEAKRYWARIVRISPETITSVNVLSGKKFGKVPYGMCRIRLTKGNDYFNLLMATVRLISADFAPVAQRIELRTPKAAM